MNAANATFDMFVSSLLDNQTLPPLRVVRDERDTVGHYTRTGAIAVVAEDESEPCAVFSNWKNHYEFEAWVAYRQMTHANQVFQAMVTDVLNNKTWGRDTISIISKINRLMQAAVPA